ncbi:DUF1652 domain-containing protein [Pseudomonas fluorescens]|jgi:hypothetical protein|uniref:DUF1652 domain-containing protein n=1 Tax=Pseudomonas TaxID=286 RepID=UPI00070B5275|nr:MULTISPECIES: DUF1652 domain-containing protein [Pseudomonas]AYG08186.1 DUF1652 domain-containing protein [Pseudomonas fluorescens]OAE17065.1 hypothetical protein A2T76_07265 [Pseudomonas brenneri]MBJ2243572.1 DUF1652 domain-containing protein [Pseudomonas sp. MF6768]MBJ2251688.1 DUF1652 domain-containing protein [Pseudomonas sp. MF6784]MBJ2260457.1 DUF1652 domain-containing protein [Pseudomonas sp. MF6787]
MFSELELRGLIEGSFLPRRCECIKAQDASLTIKIYDDDGTDLTVTGIQANKLDSSRAICNLITELREDLKHAHAPAPRRAGARLY